MKIVSKNVHLQKVTKNYMYEKYVYSLLAIHYR